MSEQKTQQIAEHAVKPHEKSAVKTAQPVEATAYGPDTHILSRLSRAASLPPGPGQGLMHPNATAHQAAMMRTLQRRQGNAFVQRAVMQGRPAASLPDHAVQQAQSDQSPGQSLDTSVQANMETSFGHDFSGVRVHTDGRAKELAQGIHAQAFTRGQDIYFGAGRYQPGTSQGKHLLAHELTHVVQQSHGSTNQKTQSAPLADSFISEAEGETEREAEMLASQVVSGDKVRVQEQTLPQPARAEDPKQISSYFEFQGRVFARAIERLESNIQKLDEWRKYIDTQFDEVGLQAQIASSETARLFQSARARGQEQSFAQWTSEHSPARRALLEGKMNGLINSGCEECHESNIVWNWNTAHEAEIRNLPTPAQSLARLAQYTELERFIKGEQSTPASGQTTPQSRAIPTQSAPSASPVQTAPMMVQPPGKSAAPPVNLQYPDVHIGLCSPLPEPDSKPEPAPFDARLWGADTAAALQSVQHIGLVLEPLGPTGYRILPGELFSTLYNRGPSALHSDVMNNMAVRQGKYRQLQNLIGTGTVSYTELCPIVEELFGSATVEVQLLVAAEITRAQVSEWILDKLMKIAGAALLLLSILFPPSAILLAAGAGLALAQIGTGIRDTLRGYQYGLGVGAGVFSPEQEASAESLYTGGIINIGTGIISLGLSGLGGLQLAKQTSWRNALIAALAEERTGPMTSGKFNPLADGSYVAFHPVNPNLRYILDGDQLTCEVFVKGDWHVLASQRSPWGPGVPPPGTMTWEEYAAPWNPPASGTGTPGTTPRRPSALVPTRPPLLLGPGTTPTGPGALAPTCPPLLLGPAPSITPGQSLPPGRINPPQISETGSTEVSAPRTEQLVRPHTKVEWDRLSWKEHDALIKQFMDEHGIKRIIVSNEHHAWPKYLGGPEEGPLISLDKHLHDIYHSGLDKVLPRIPKNLLPDETATEYYAKLSSAEKAKNLDILKRYTLDFDIVFGTKISDVLKKALANTPYKY